MSKIIIEDKEFLYQNSDIPAKNKVQDTDINTFKNTINQEGAYTTCTYDGAGAYKCTLLGSLTAGDTVKLFVPLSNQASSTDSNITISIDGGTTYYNLIDKYKSFNLMASDFEYSDIYLIAVYNGTNLVALSPDRVKNIMVLRLASDYEAPSGLNYYNLSTLTSIYYQRGKRFSKGSITPTSQSSVLAGVKIGNGIDLVRTSFTSQVQNTNSSSSMYIIMYGAVCTSGGSSSNWARAGFQTIPAGNFVSLTAGECVLPVNENDIIGLRIYKSMSTGTATVGYENRTYLTVEEV